MFASLLAAGVASSAVAYWMTGILYDVVWEYRERRGR